MKLKFILFFFIFYNYTGFAQISPFVKQMDRLIDHPVSLNTGMPNIDIPLFSIDCGGQQIPVTLSYVATGIKVNHTSGEVGLGWVLSPNYRVTKSSMGPNSEKIPNLDSIETVIGSGSYKDDVLVKFTSTVDRVNLPTIINQSGHYNGEHDIYRYALADRSGTFAIPNNDEKNKVLLLDAPKNSLSIKFKSDYSNPVTPFFTILDDRGWKYTAGENEIGDYSGRSIGFPVNNIYAPNGDIINFEYNGYDELASPTFNSSIRVIEGCINSSGFNAFTDVAVDTGTTDSLAYFSRRISSITHNKGRLEYSRNQRGLLQSITSYDLFGATSKTVNFFYSRHYQNNNYIFLDSVSVNGPDQVYRFEYDTGTDNDEATYVNNKTFWVDYWGYYAGGIDGHGRSDIGIRTINEFDIYNVDSHNTPSNLNTLLGYLVPSGDYFSPKEGGSFKMFSLNRIIQPGGGFTEYHYEKNAIQDGSGTDVSGGGLRIAEIVSNDILTGATMRRVYTYGDNTSDAGYTLDPITHRSHIQQKAIIGGILTSSFSISKWGLYNTYSFTNEASYFDQGPVYYTKVTERFYDPSGLTGKTEYNYSYPSTGSVKAFQTNALPIMANRGLVSRNFPSLYRGDEYYGRRPVLESKVYYKNDNGWKKVRDEVNTYQWFNDPVTPFLRNFVVKQYAKMGGWPTNIYSTSHLSQDNIYGDVHIDSFFDYGFYSIYSNWSKLINTKVTEYHD